MAYDPESVTLQSGYRTGFSPPAPGSLAPGELYVELTSPDAPGVPALWMGLPDYLGIEGNIAQLATMAAPAASETGETA